MPPKAPKERRKHPHAKGNAPKKKDAKAPSSNRVTRSATAADTTASVASKTTSTSVVSKPENKSLSFRDAALKTPPTGEATSVAKKPYKATPLNVKIGRPTPTSSVTVSNNTTEEPSPISTTTNANLKDPVPLKSTNEPSPSSGTFDSNGLDSNGFTKDLRKEIKKLNRTQDEMFPSLTDLSSHTKKHTRFDDGNIEEYRQGQEDRLNEVEQAIEKMETTMWKMETRLDKVDTKVDKIDNQVDRIDQRFDKMNTHMGTIDKSLSGLGTQLIRLIEHIEKKDGEHYPSTSSAAAPTKAHGSRDGSDDKVKMVAVPDSSPSDSTVPTPLDTKSVDSDEHSDKSSDSVDAPKSSKLFGQNEFSIACGDKKIRYNDMATFLSSKEMYNDSTQQLEKLYNYVCRSINYAFQTHLMFLPNFRDLHQEIRFRSCFLQNLHGSTLLKCESVYDRLGDIVKDMLMSPTCIKKSASPLAHEVISDNDDLDGWSLLEMLLTKRLVLCGAQPDIDLDYVLSTLEFRTGESYKSFYSRTKQLVNQYKLQSKDDLGIPMPKIINRFILELNRADEYVPYLTLKFDQLLTYINTYGLDNNNMELHFSLQDIRDHLDRVRAPMIPRRPLRLSTVQRIKNNISKMTEIPDKIEVKDVDPRVALFHDQNENQEIEEEEDITYERIAAFTDSDDFQAIIRSYEAKAPSDDCHNPTICKTQGLKKRCQACLRGFHDEVNCYLRGQNFMPEALRQRINVYNKINGTSPPKGHVPPEWKPNSIPATHAKNDKRRSSFKNGMNPKRKGPNPFANNKTKLPQINWTEALYDENDQDIENGNDDNDEAVLARFVSQQEKQVEEFGDFYLTDDNDSSEPTICSVHAKDFAPIPDMETNNNNIPSALTFTPPALTTLLQSFFMSNKLRPSKQFLRQHAKEVARLPPSKFTLYKKVNFQVDSGANVSAINDPSLFYFFIRTKTEINQASGSEYTSQGWGGLLIQCGKNTHLLAPVHLTPESPCNLFSVGSLRTFSGFQKAIHSLHDKLFFVDSFGNSCTYPVQTTNGLDFKTFQVLSFHKTILSNTNLLVDPLQQLPMIESHPQRSVNNNSTSPDLPIVNMNTTTELIDNELSAYGKLPVLPRNVLSLIATFYVHLHRDTSPQEKAISTMNQLLANHFARVPQDTTYIFGPYPETALTDISDNSYCRPITNKLSRKSSRNLANWQEYIHLHLATMHASDSVLGPMIKKKLLLDLPSIGKHIGKFNCTCMICTLTKPRKLNKGKLLDKTPVEPFTMIHADFSFYGHTSIRGFVSAFDIVDATTSFPIGIPTKSRNPPLGIFEWVIHSLRAQGKKPIILRVDEDGALAKSAEFCKLVIRMKMILQTTAGGNSINNGKVERPHQTSADMIRSSISTMNMIMHEELSKIDNLCAEDFWCFNYTNSVNIRRKLYNRSVGDIPYFLVHKKRPSAKELVPVGSLMTIINPTKNMLPKLSQNRANRGYFLGFGNHIKSLLYWDPKNPRTYKRAHHAIIEDMATLTILQKSFLTPQSDPSFTLDSMKEQFSSRMIGRREFDVKNCPFPKENIFTITIPVPPLGQSLGLEIRDDNNFTMPFIFRTRPQSIAHSALPPGRRTNQFILHINAHSPITSNFVVEYIRKLQKDEVTSMELDLVSRGRGDMTTSLAITRAMFDQMPHFLDHRPILNKLEVDKATRKSMPRKNLSLPTSEMVFVRSAEKPVAPKLWHQTQSSHLRHNWKAAAWEGFKNNKKIAVFSLPFPSVELPKGVNVFGVLLVPEVKATDVPGVWQLRVRECVVGTPQKKTIDFDNSYSPTVDALAVKITISFCATLGYHIGIIDVKNAFQNTISRESQRIYVRVPPTYLEWLANEENFDYDHSTTYFRQMLNANQGTKDAGNQWYALLCKVLIEYGMIRSTVDHGLFVKKVTDIHHLYIALATDDLLCGFHNYNVLEDLAAYLRKYFVIVIQTGGVLKFLGLRIIQTEKAISIDQSHYIFEMLEEYFGTDPEQIIKTAAIPMRSDAELEKELFESPPLTDTELREYSIKYRGGYRHHTGKLNYAVDTRFDIQFAVQRLSEYNCSPTAAAFQNIDRIMKYLAQDVLRPLVYPRKSLLESSKVTMMLTPDTPISLDVSHQPTLFTDAELARDLATRRSYYCIVVTILNVIVLCKIKKSSKTMIHTTDSEAQASFDGVRRLLPIRALCEFLGFPLANPTQHFVDNSAVNQIITSERMTPRCRHFDLPIAFLHEHHGVTFTSKLVKTTLQLADIGTKPLVKFLHNRLKLWGSGARFIPEKEHEHYKLLEMKYYEMKFQDILKEMNNSNQLGD